MKPPGTVLPTAAGLRAGDAHAARVDTARDLAGAAIPDATRRAVAGEVRYYRGPTRYALVTRSLVVIWFDVRLDGDYPVKP